MPSAAWLPMLLAASFTPPTALGTPIRSESEPEVCVTVATVWRGSTDEVRRIAELPVPESYRRLYGWTGCQHLVKGSLVRWHLAFGDKRSTTRALDFLVATTVEGQPSVEKFQRTLPAVWRRAALAARASIPRPTTTGAARQERVLALRRDPAIRRLQALYETYQRFALLAELHLQAAEFFGSRTLLDRADAYLGPLVEAGRMFHEGRRVAMAAEGSLLQSAVGVQYRGPNELADLRMRYAVARARISRSAADLSTAAAIVAEYDDETMRATAEPLIERGSDFCDAVTASGTLRRSCEEENDLEGRLRSFWRSAAWIDVMTGTEARRAGVPFGAFDVAWRVIGLEEDGTGPRTVRYNGGTDDRVALLLARADETWRRAMATGASAEGSSSLRIGALEDLFQAERLTPPSLNPNRFRQVAELYLAIYETLPRDVRAGAADEARQASYLRRVLGDLSGIEAGEPESRSRAAP